LKCLDDATGAIAADISSTVNGRNWPKIIISLDLLGVRFGESRRLFVSQ
jgi:hypothetical protein